MEIILFRTNTRDDIDEAAYGNAFEKMLGEVSSVPGFIDIAGFTGEDGSELAVVRFESAEALANWKQNPAHVATQQRGRDEFFENYDIIVATVTRQYDWKR